MAAHAARPRSGGHRGRAVAGVPDLRGRRARRRRDGGADRRPHGGRPCTGLGGVGQLAVEPDRPGAPGRAPGQGGQLGPGARARSSSPTSATSSSAGTPVRCRCCTPRSAEARTAGLLAVHSLSKRSNLAGYRAGLVAGDPTLVAELLAVRKHLGMMVPAPVQAAAAAALADDEHVARQRTVYAERRLRLGAALEGAGFRIDHSEAGLYLWATRGEPCRETLAWLAELRDPRRPRGLLRRRRRGARTRGAHRDRRTGGGSRRPARVGQLSVRSRAARRRARGRGGVGSPRCRRPQ